MCPVSPNMETKQWLQQTFLHIHTKRLGVSGNSFRRISSASNKYLEWQEWTILKDPPNQTDNFKEKIKAR